MTAWEWLQLLLVLAAGAASFRAQWLEYQREKREMDEHHARERDAIAAWQKRCREELRRPR